ncbi:TadE/TadG family type IV pilus assembly protein [Bradyrhizobium aeschynomenes]|uniref:TadE/TadG family type IV pilus assembly protein n=1 Tax=Bradyrhizobium aeschynomenes TaxID=2734909 RepID=UPI00155699CA|nr:TadE/TadG family type IV pilus assembly protein [Bradyrhizobium aeschynomenes]NPV20492.1 pilus assembly protein [Bradyrhizobium aeschynomenes]
MRFLTDLLARFRRDVSGNVAVTFAIVCVPVITAVGCGIDYSRNNQMRAKLQAAVDAASVGAVSRTAPAFIAAGSMTGDGPIAVGNDDARKIFNGNMSGTSGYTLNSLTPDVKKSGSVVSATVSFTATVPTMFMSIVGFKTMTLQGSSTAKASMPKYIDFYLLLDNSPSMGVAATPDDVTKMVNNTSDKCAFACHDYNDSNNYYNLAKKLGVTTRIDVLRSATQQLMDKAAATQTYPNQFRMALYDFGAASKTIGLRSLFALSSNLSSAKSAAGNIDLMGVYGNNDAYTADKDTPFSTVFPAINNEISTPGDGTTGSPLKYLFFVSDGVADESNAACLKAKASGNRCQSPLNPALCTALKNRGIKIAVLYTTYLQLPTNSWYMSWIDPFNKGPFGPSPNSEIAQNMQACASDGYYTEVSPTQGIAEALRKLFDRAVADARIAS